MTWWDFQGHQHEGPAPEHDMTNGQDMDYSAVDDDTPYERPKRKPGTWTTKDGRGQPAPRQHDPDVAPTG
jgi:hypothetical protein